MDKKQATSIIGNTFNNTFNKNAFVSFIGNLLNLHSDAISLKNIEIYDSYKQHIKSLELVTKYSDGQNNIDVLIVNLVRDTSLDRARTMQRNFIARYLNEKQGDAALVSFHSDDAIDWRFSLIKMEYEITKTKTGFKFKQEINHNLSAKRWSFLVGKNERSHTAQKQLVDILANDKNSPSLNDLEHAFNIESVTKEFFEKYTDLFHRMKESLDSLIDKDKQLKSEFELKEIDTSDFAKKTLGQMAFLYFLQKKGWFGVAPGKEWGSGVKNFLRKVFERRKKYGKNFFDDVLEPLFYEALAQDRGNESIYPKLNNCRMPFLNGGLFEPMNGYSWETTHIRLPDSLFSNNNKTKEGDIGDGILDIFDRYNFTVNESDPLEMEVAVDPEMLGKVFENLLEIKDRKSKGAFYTPREIVHYMCQESLINYLDTETKNLISKSDLEFFIRKGSRIIQNDKALIDLEKESEDSEFKFPKSIQDQASILDSLLSNIKVCDPAVGSGAFPLGMLNEIVNARTILGTYLKTNPVQYDLKLHAISNSIYGVDIDPGAIEIAKLRFWLSLVVEEDSPTPLPNLDHKIMQGNSLISKYEGIELFDDEFLKTAESVNTEKQEIKDKLNKIQTEYLSLHSSGELTSIKKTEIEKNIQRFQRRLKFLDQENIEAMNAVSLFDENEPKKVAQQKSKLLQKKIAEYVSIVGKTDKENLKKEIDDLKWDLIELTLEQQKKTEKLNEIRELRKRSTKPFFIWKLEFGEVFKENDGFDVVIGNPPYVNVEKFGKNSSFISTIKKTYPQIWQDKSDLLFYFIAKSIEIAKANSYFIVSNAFLFSDKARHLRKFIQMNAPISKLINFEKYTAFENAMITTAIVHFNKENSQKITKFLNLKESQYKKSDFLKLAEDASEYSDVVFEQDQVFALVDEFTTKLNNKIDSNHPKLGDLFTVGSGMQTGANKVYSSEKFPTSFPKKYLKHHLTGTSIKDYYIDLDELNSILFVEEDPSFESLPLPIQEYLLSNKSVLENRADKKRRSTAKWWTFTFPMHIDKYHFNKLWTSYRGKENRFVFDDSSDCVGLTNTTVIFGDNSEFNLKYILGLLNSKLINYRYKSIGKQTGGGVFEYFENGIKKIPIPKVNSNIQLPIANLVDEILNLKERDPHKCIEKIKLEIDELVFNLYDISPEERQSVLNSLDQNN